MFKNGNWKQEMNESYLVDDEWEKITNKGNSNPNEPEPEFDYYGTALNEI